MVLPTVYVLMAGPKFLASIVEELTYTWIGFGILWLFASATIAYVVIIEKQPLSSIGWRSLSFKWGLAAAGMGIILSLLVPIFTLSINAVIPAQQAGSIDDIASGFPWWIVLVSVITAGVTEEILFRGYSLERLLEATGNKWSSAALSLAFFVLIHAAGWNIAHILGVVLPLGAVLTSLYLWKRNLLFVIIVHIMIDLPLVFLAFN